MDVLQTIKIRRSVRKYKSDPIPDGVMGELIESLRLAPSACNYQPWKFVFITDPEVKDRIAGKSDRSRDGQAGNARPWIAEAPLIVVGCGFPDQTFQFMGGKGSSVDVDLSIALDHLTLYAASRGLGTCWIGAFDEGQVKEILAIPADVKVVALTPVGYPQDEDALKEAPSEKRKKKEEIISWNTF